MKTIVESKMVKIVLESKLINVRKVGRLHKRKIKSSKEIL